VTPGLVARVHADGRKLLVFTVNTREDMDRMERLGVDGIFTDFPDRWTGK
jgi:glycerophosphoryl diester phosphodiesterase